MKILKETTDSQTLRIIPRKYVDTVDLTITNERTNTPVTFSGLAATTNGGYLDIDHVFDLKEDNNYSFEVKTISQEAGVKCIAANNEYLSSPAGNYLPVNSDDIDIEIEYRNLSSDGYLITMGEGDVGGKNLFAITPSVNFNYININMFITDTEYGGFILTPIPSSGNIKLKGGSGNVDVLIDDVLVGVLTGGFNASLIFDNLIFNGINTVPIIDVGLDVVFDYIKFQNHEWAYDNWTSPTTTNSEGVVTTLHSDVSTDAMIIEESTSETIYKGKIFCTNQDNYSINNGIYKERGKNNEYVIYE